jgi:hypothetical protein
LIFDFPESQESRRHGPAGYSVYESYRPWLRDEFDFRCVYCLKREMWGQATSEFELDHFQPQALDPQRSRDYLNLVYACRRCNAVKQDQIVSDPFRLLKAPFVTTHPDGVLRSHSNEARRLILQLDLNAPRMVAWRVMWMRIVALAQEVDPELHRRRVEFPPDLPDLKKLRPPQNTRPAGVQQCWFEKRRAGILPSGY